MLSFLSPLVGGIAEAVEKSFAFEPVKPVTDKLSLKLPHDMSNMDRYEAAAKDLGYTPLVLNRMKTENKTAQVHHDIVSAFIDASIPYYPLDLVKDYMDALVKKLGHRPENKYHHVIRWDWTNIGNYEHAVPIEMLERAKKVKELFEPQSSRPRHVNYIVVTDISRRIKDPDPFIGIYLEQGVYVFGVWEEPSFGNIAGADKSLNK